jgi:hypothetical protein
MNLDGDKFYIPKFYPWTQMETNFIFITFTYELGRRQILYENCLFQGIENFVVESL